MDDQTFEKSNLEMGDVTLEKCSLEMGDETVEKFSQGLVTRSLKNKVYRD